ncbi:MAG: hypothetical protein K8R25_11075 [Methanosarcinales archaeon]|nr:hypothetical protein [Methanosarcinales archaeon]
MKTKEGYGKPEKAIIDTAPPISLIPFDMWRHMEIKYIGEDYLRGVVPDKNKIKFFCYINLMVSNSTSDYREFRI